MASTSKLWERFFTNKLLDGREAQCGFILFSIKTSPIVVQLQHSVGRRPSRVSFKLNFLSKQHKSTCPGRSSVAKWFWKLKNCCLYQNSVLMIALDFLVAWTCSLFGGQFMGELSRTVKRLGMYDRIALGGTSPRRRRYLFNLYALWILHNIVNYSLERCFTVCDREIYVVVCSESIFEEDFSLIHF